MAGIGNSGKDYEPGVHKPPFNWSPAQIRVIETRIIGNQEADRASFLDVRDQMTDPENHRIDRAAAERLAPGLAYIIAQGEHDLAEMRAAYLEIIDRHGLPNLLDPEGPGNILRAVRNEPRSIPTHSNGQAEAV